MTAIVQAVGLRKTYGMNGVAVEAVRGVDLSVEKGEFVALVGPSGSGKSSLLHMIGAMDRPTAGEVLFEGRSLAALTEGELSSLRARRIGFIFQTFNLLPTLTASENVEIAMRLAGVGRAARRARAQQLLERLELAERSKHRPSRLSGGERQRVAIARALANSPALVLADEPTGNLDSRTGAGILELLRSVCASEDRAVVMVTHDMGAASCADRVVSMLDGRISADPAALAAPAVPAAAVSTTASAHVSAGGAL
jgi:putative ABC transport system ATP-binding protein